MTRKFLKSACLSGTACAIVLALSTPAAQAVVVPAGKSPDAPEYLDTQNTRPYWVGLGIRSSNGQGGSCTGLLINPRTVLFAAHCVDDESADVYNAPGSVAAVGYTTDGLFGADNLAKWINGTAGANDPQMVNSVGVFFHPAALENQSNIEIYPDRGSNPSFLSADIALAAFGQAHDLGRGAKNSIGLLFSPVRSKVNVIMGGYGAVGTGDTGQDQYSEIDSFKRRLGTNILGFLGSERDISLAVYPTDPQGVPVADFVNPPLPGYQDLYWTDFDDPDGESPYDFDVFKDAATAKEISTAQGDSGSPLVTGDYVLADGGQKREVSLGVLSQGTGFYVGQPEWPYLLPLQSPGAYGTAAGYNPLFLFWDYIVANNPYKYVSAKAGDGEWTDAKTWVQDLDPLYYVLNADGKLVNGLPTTPALGVSDAAPNVGTVSTPPYPLAACAYLQQCPGNPYEDPEEEPSDAVRGVVKLGPQNQAMPGYLTADAKPVAVEVAPKTTEDAPKVIGEGPWPVKPGTEPLSGPGSTNFVPNNVIGAAGVHNATHYFEVSLVRAGQISLSKATVTIDRLNVSGGQSTLNIREGARLNTVLTSYLDAGNLNVDGTLSIGRVAGESPKAARLEMAGGRLSGTGRIEADVLIRNGVLSPGSGTNGVGELNIEGQLDIGGTGVLGIDIQSATQYDRLRVRDTAKLGGTLAVNLAAGLRPVYGQTFTNILTANAREGSFALIADNITGVLRAETVLNARGFDLVMGAESYSRFVNASSAVQVTFGRMLDASRAQAGIKSLYADLDLLEGAPLQASLESLAPHHAPNLMLALRASQRPVRDVFAQRPLDREATGTRVFATLSHSDGTGRNAGFATQALRASINGLTFGAGVERRFGDWTLGGGATIAELESKAGQTRADVRDIQLHATARFAGQGVNYPVVDARLATGTVTADLTRTALTAPTTYSLSAVAKGTRQSLDLTGGYVWSVAKTGQVMPYVAYSQMTTDLDSITETGGAAALTLAGQKVRERQTRFGVKADYVHTLASGLRLRPSLDLASVRASGQGARALDAAFAAAPTARFSLTPVAADRSWTEARLGLVLEGKTQSLSVSYDADLGRKDLDLKQIQARWSLAF